jgi:hypothetical protein
MKRKVTNTAEEEEEQNGNGEGGEGKEKEGKEEQQTPTPPPPPQTPTPPPQPPKTATTTASADFNKGVEAERARVTALQALDRPATHAIIEAAIKDGKQVSDIYTEVFAAMEKAGKQSDRHQDASVLNNIPPSDGADDGNNNFGALLTKKVKARMKGRSPLRRQS